MKTSTRIVLAFLISFLLGVIFPLFKGQDLLSSLQSGSIFALIVVTIVAILSCGIDIAVKKGYPSWVGFLLVLILNILGLAILAILPSKTAVNNNSASK
jgi:hypothetical protein